MRGNKEMEYMRSMERIMKNNNVYARRQGEVPERGSFYTKEPAKIREKIYKRILDRQDKRRASRCRPNII